MWRSRSCFSSPMLWGCCFHLRLMANCSRRGGGNGSRVADRSGGRLLAGVTILVALVSEVFVGSVQEAAIAFGMTPAFVGFIVVSLVGGAAEMAAAFSAARKNHLDLSVSIALGSAAQIALFVAPVLVLLSFFVGPTPMDLNFWPGAVTMIFFATLTASAGHKIRPLRLVRRRAGADGLPDVCHCTSSPTPEDLELLD